MLPKSPGCQVPRELIPLAGLKHSTHGSCLCCKRRLKLGVWAGTPDHPLLGRLLHPCLQSLPNLHSFLPIPFLQVSATMRWDAMEIQIFLHAQGHRKQLRIPEKGDSKQFEIANKEEKLLCTLSKLALMFYQSLLIQDSTQHMYRGFPGNHRRPGITPLKL